MSFAAFRLILASMPSTIQSLTIVIPAYNESKRLPFTLEDLKGRTRSLSENFLNLEKVIVVDDGSQDQTASVLENFKKDLPLELISYKTNQGKGFAIRTGARESTSDLTLIADADMSTPWMNVTKLRDFIDKGFDVCIGSRALADSRISVRQPWYRERMGKTFNLLMRLITGLPFRDTQCGFKLLKTQTCSGLWSRLQVNRFAWDIELLMLAQNQGLRIREIGVEWDHREESRVHPIRDSLEMLWSVFKVRFRRL